MRVVICGGGMVGGELARKLTMEKHDIVVVDDDKEVCDKLYAELGIVAINGNSALLETLLEAEVDKAKLLVAATNRDADNLSCAILAKSLGVPQIIVRVNNPAYANAYKLVGVDSLVWGTTLVVNQMIMEIEHPRARNISSLAGGKATVFSIVIPLNSAIAGKTVKEIALKRSFPSDCVLIAAYHPTTKELSIPRGDMVVKENDELFLISSPKAMEKAISFMTSVKR